MQRVPFTRAPSPLCPRTCFHSVPGITVLLLYLWKAFPQIRHNQKEELIFWGQCSAWLFASQPLGVFAGEAEQWERHPQKTLCSHLELYGSWVLWYIITVAWCKRRTDRPVEDIHPRRRVSALPCGWEKWLHLAVPTQCNYCVEQTQPVG